MIVDTVFLGLLKSPFRWSPTIPPASSFHFKSFNAAYRGNFMPWIHVFSFLKYLSYCIICVNAFIYRAEVTVNAGKTAQQFVQLNNNLGEGKYFLKFRLWLYFRNNVNTAWIKGSLLWKWGKKFPLPIQPHLLVKHTKHTQTSPKRYFLFNTHCTKWEIKVQCFLLIRLHLKFLNSILLSLHVFCLSPLLFVLYTSNTPPLPIPFQSNAEKPSCVLPPRPDQPAAAQPRFGHPGGWESLGLHGDNEAAVQR